MTQLELIAEIGGAAVEVVNMYLTGRLTARELTRVVGVKKALAAERYVREREEGMNLPV